MRAAKVQASLRIRAVSPEPSLLAHTSSESRGTFRQKARSLTPLNGWACAVKICHDGMLEDTNSLDGAQIWLSNAIKQKYKDLFLTDWYNKVDSNLNYRTFKHKFEFENYLVILPRNFLYYFTSFRTEIISL